MCIRTEGPGEKMVTKMALAGHPMLDSNGVNPSRVSAGHALDWQYGH